MGGSMKRSRTAAQEADQQIIEGRKRSEKINISLEHFQRTGQPIPEQVLLNILSFYLESNGRFLPHRLLPQKIEIQKITRAAQIILRRTRAQHEGAMTGFYNVKTRQFVSGKFVSGEKRRVSPEIFLKGQPDIYPLFVIHNHPDIESLDDQVSFFSTKDFQTFLKIPYLQFLVMVTRHRVYILMKTTKTAAAFAEKDVQAEIQVATAARDQEIKRQMGLKRGKLTQSEVFDIHFNFNLAVCEALQLGFYSSAKIGRVSGNRKVILEKRN